jgi:hypothetical protein
MHFNFFENDISYQTFHMNLNKIVWRFFKNIPRIFYEYFPKSNHTSSHKVGGCGSCCYVCTQNHLGQKQSHKRSYTIPRRPLEERGGGWAKATSRNQPKCNHSIYDYMWLIVVCNYIWEYLQL